MSRSRGGAQDHLGASKAGGVPPLRRGGDRDGVLGRDFADRGGRGVLVSRVDDGGVDFVGDNSHVVLRRQLHHVAQFFLAEHPAERIIGTAQDQRPGRRGCVSRFLCGDDAAACACGAGCEDLLQGREVERALRSHGHLDRGPPGDVGDLKEGVIGGDWQHDRGASGGELLDGNRHTLDHVGDGANPIGGEAPAEPAFVEPGECFSQLHVVSGVAEIFAVHAVLDGVGNGGAGVEVGLRDPHGDDVLGVAAPFLRTAEAQFGQGGQFEGAGVVASHGQQCTRPDGGVDNSVYAVASGAQLEFN